MVGPPPTESVAQLLLCPHDMAGPLLPVAGVKMGTVIHDTLTQQNFFGRKSEERIAHSL